MKKIYYLSTCSTCSRIIKELDLKNLNFEFQDIKTHGITPGQLLKLKELSGSYESLFSKVALKYKSLNPKPKSESEYENLILEEYTYLKRPVIVIDSNCFIGNSKKNIENVFQYLNAAQK